MKAVMLSIKPKYCELIANGEKTVEVRKTMPKLETPFKCYIYCTKGNPNNVHELLEIHNGKSKILKANGKVIGEFVCDYINYIPPIGLVDVVDCESSCLSAKEIIEYSNGKMLYGWHISNLAIYDEPRELRDFRKHIPFFDGITTEELEEEGVNGIRLTRPPQSWCYVEEMESEEE